jgi:hypothetical protein
VRGQGVWIGTFEHRDLVHSEQDAQDLVLSGDTAIWESRDKNEWAVRAWSKSEGSFVLRSFAEPKRMPGGIASDSKHVVWLEYDTDPSSCSLVYAAHPLAKANVALTRLRGHVCPDNQYGSLHVGGGFAAFRSWSAKAYHVRLVRLADGRFWTLGSPCTGGRDFCTDDIVLVSSKDVLLSGKVNGVRTLVRYTTSSLGPGSPAPFALEALSGTTDAGAQF